jgi:hypothetical protein
MEAELGCIKNGEAVDFTDAACLYRAKAHEQLNAHMRDGRRRIASHATTKTSKGAKTRGQEEMTKASS